MEDGLEWSTMQVRETLVSPVELEERRSERTGDASRGSVTEEKGGGWDTRSIAQVLENGTTIEAGLHASEAKRTEPRV